MPAASDADDHNTAVQGPLSRNTFGGNPMTNLIMLTVRRWAPRFQACTVCSGTGVDPNTSEKCDNCDGKGRTD